MNWDTRKHTHTQHQVSSSGSSREISPSCSPGNNSLVMNNSSSCLLNPPRYGTTVPNRIFVGGITTDVRRQFFSLFFLAPRLLIHEDVHLTSNYEASFPCESRPLVSCSQKRCRHEEGREKPFFFFLFFLSASFSHIFLFLLSSLSIRFLTDKRM